MGKPWVWEPDQMPNQNLNIIPFNRAHPCFVMENIEMINTEHKEAK